MDTYSYTHKRNVLVMLAHEFKHKLTEPELYKILHTGRQILETSGDTSTGLTLSECRDTVAAAYKDK